MHLERCQQGDHSSLEHVLFAEGGHIADDLVGDSFIDLGSGAIVLQPRVVQQILRRGATSRVLRQTFHHEVDSFCRERLPHLAKLGHIADDRPVDVLLGAAVERRTTRQDDMRDDSDTPNIDTLVILLFSHDLWRHVKGRAENLAQTALGTIEAGEAEIGKL